MKGRNARLMMLSIIAMALFTFPMVNLLKDYRVYGSIPAILPYLLITWLAIIGVIAFEVSRKN